MSVEARREMGMLLRELQEGRLLSMPHSRPMPDIGVRCHELRVNEENKAWRLVYRIDPDAIVILDVFEKRTKRTPQQVIEICRRRLRRYEANRP